ncbi:hypothetical protein HJG53_15270 [Sphingomonas sp. ID1715]|uniref:hypothetical protein n=1 Tax=Sphingomonas sp. ID1715 TaxID=1656898 RepID=UPI0014881550|nr:hypothetical protein [Sphingomonas sp. ID1715]NNM78252.1 hypothetical protein [Sphingomonas sp. ID1715]
MLFHLSIEADDPKRTAEVLAEIWNGVAMPFAAVAEGSWMAFHPADNGTMIEVYPRGTDLAIGDKGALGLASSDRRASATHFAMSTDKSIEEIYAIAEREGWHAQYFSRGGAFGVIEVWIDGCQMIEVLTPEMQREYLDNVTIANWTRMIDALEAQKLAA